MIECRSLSCQEKILRTAHMCPEHWNAIPQALQVTVNIAYQHGVDSEEYKQAGAAVLEWMKVNAR